MLQNWCGIPCGRSFINLLVHGINLSVFGNASQQSHRSRCSFAPNVVLMLARRLRRRPNIKTTLGQCLETVLRDNPACGCYVLPGIANCAWFYFVWQIITEMKAVFLTSHRVRLPVWLISPPGFLKAISAETRDYRSGVWGDTPPPPSLYVISNDRIQKRRSKIMGLCFCGAHVAKPHQRGAPGW